MNAVGPTLSHFLHQRLPGKVQAATEVPTSIGCVRMIGKSFDFVCAELGPNDTVEARRDISTPC
jgi:hypothetical protein